MMFYKPVLSRVKDIIIVEEDWEDYAAGNDFFEYFSLTLFLRNLL